MSARWCIQQLSMTVKNVPVLITYTGITLITGSAVSAYSAYPLVLSHCRPLRFHQKPLLVHLQVPIVVVVQRAVKGARQEGALKSVDGHTYCYSSCLEPIVVGAVRVQ